MLGMRFFRIRPPGPDDISKIANPCENHQLEVIAGIGFRSDFNGSFLALPIATHYLSTNYKETGWVMGGRMVTSW
jgi:hypothetical protein